jgi:hypothetical protein
MVKAYIKAYPGGVQMAEELTFVGRTSGLIRGLSLSDASRIGGGIA